MTTKITGQQNQPVQVKTSTTVQRPQDSASAPATAAPKGNPVQITEQARQMAALEQAIQSMPAVNYARVAEIRSAIEEGRYHVAPERIAEKLLRMEQDLSVAER